MERNWEKITIFIISIMLVMLGVGNVLLAYVPEFNPRLPLSKTLVVGTLEGPVWVDPVNCFEGSSEDVIIQVCEGLYQHNLSDPNHGIIPQLADDYWTWDPSATRFTIPLRQNVTFHDGTPFNAEAVKWNFERINWFMNGTGTLNSTISENHNLWEYPNGTTILNPLNPITVNSEYNITINLRAPFAVLESLLCHESAYILSPESSPKYEYIHPVYGRVFGTGPFVYDYYRVNTEVKLHRWDHYWGGSAFFEEVNFTIINDATTRNNAMLDHTIDYLIGSMSSLFPTFDADPTITHKSGIRASSYYFLGMNNEVINITWRQAISYGLNYTYITEELQEGTVYRANGPLAPDLPGYNPTIQAATYNLTKARELVLSMGLGDAGWTDAQWSTANLRTWNYSYNIGNDFREDLLILLQDNLALIGIEVIDQGMTWVWPGWPHRPPLDFRLAHLYWTGDSPDYLSPYNLLYRLFSNKSTVNYNNYHNHDVEMWLDQVLEEPNSVTRQALYANILHQIIEVDMPHAFGYHPYSHSVHSAGIYDVPYNSIGKFYIYPMYRSYF